MKQLDLFSGIGGFALASRWMGWETVGFVEIDKFCQKVLNKNFPNIPIHGDIKTFNGESLRGTVDIITGGFPCQPFSVAGQRKGKKDDRFIWPEMLRTIREVKPRWVVGENVTGIIGLALDQVLTEMENEGYNTETYIIPACAVNAPHRRDRVWIIANHKSIGGSERIGKKAKYRGWENCEPLAKGSKIWNRNQTISGARIPSNTQRIGQPRSWQFIKSISTTESREWQASWSDNVGTWPNESPVRIGNDGLSSRLVRSAIQGAGNAIVPQVAFEIFRAIEAMDTILSKQNPVLNPFES